jgi:hypothetical protein
VLGIDIGEAVWTVKHRPGERWPYTAPLWRWLRHHAPDFLFTNYPDRALAEWALACGVETPCSGVPFLYVNTVQEAFECINRGLVSQRATLNAHDRGGADLQIRIFARSRRMAARTRRMLTAFRNPFCSTTIIIETPGVVHRPERSGSLTPDVLVYAGMNGFNGVPPVHDPTETVEPWTVHYRRGRLNQIDPLVRLTVGRRALAILELPAASGDHGGSGAPTAHASFDLQRVVQR